MLSDTHYDFPILTLSIFHFVIDFLGTSTKLTPLQLEALLTEGNTSRFWLVGSIDLFSNFKDSWISNINMFALSEESILLYCRDPNMLLALHY